MIARLNEVEECNRQLDIRIRDLLQANGDITEHLHKAMAREAAPTPCKISLDVFDNTLDQVSEAHVKTNGRLSVEGLNDSIDNLVNSTIEQATELATNYSGDRSLVCKGDSSRLKEKMLATLTLTDLTEDSRGLILDASLHHIIVDYLHSLFFRGEVVTVFIEDTDIVEKIFRRISDNGAVTFYLFLNWIAY